MSKQQRSAARFIRSWMHRKRVPGVSIAVVQRGRRAIARGYGFRNRESGLPATSRTVYPLGSTTKSFTALAVLRLEEERKLATKDPVAQYLPEFRTPDDRASRRITIHHLLTHTSGLPPLPSCVYTVARNVALEPSYDPEEDRTVGIDPNHTPIDSYEQLVEYLGTERYRLLGPPGRWFSYSNEGFGLLGAVIEQASGRSYENYLEEEILRPAGMRSTTFKGGVTHRHADVATLYAPNPTAADSGLIPLRVPSNAPCLRAAGGLSSNVKDLSRYLQIFLDDGKVGTERVVTAASVRKMTTPYTETFPGLWYGYGVSLRSDYYGTPLAYHSGALPGVASLFVVAPRRSLAGAVLTNAGVQPERALMSEINARLRLPLRTPIEPIPRPGKAESSLRPYEGWYANGEGTWFEVRARRSSLWFDFHGTKGKLRGLLYRPAGDDHFVSRFDGEDDRVRFVRDDRRRVWAAFRYGRLVRRHSPRDFPRARLGTVVW